MKQAVLWAAFLWVVACGSELALAPFRRLQPFWSLVTALPPAYGSYPAQLAQLINRTVINAGISGEESDQGRARLAGLLEQHQPQLLILSWRQRPAAQTPQGTTEE